MTLGQFKFRVTRLQSYFTIIATAINMGASFIILGISYWWLLLFIPLLYGLHYIDKHKVHPYESSTQFSDNLEWQKMMKMVKEIYDRKN